MRAVESGGRVGAGDVKRVGGVDLDDERLKVIVVPGAITVVVI